MCLSRSITNIILCFGLCLVLSIGSAKAQAQEPIEFPRSELVIQTASGEVHFDIEVADTPERRAHGYMFREDIPPMTGMLFDFGRTRPVAMWMRNTPTSLDMLFIDASGTIRHIFENTEPFSETVLASPVNVLSVFEVPAGTVKASAIALGDKVVHDIFR